MRNKLALVLSLLMLSICSCGKKEENQTFDNEIVYEIDGVTFYDGNNYFLSMTDDCSIINKKDNSIDLRNLTKDFDLMHYGFIKDDIVCIGEFDSDYSSKTKAVYTSELTVHEYCKKLVDSYDTIYIGPYFMCYKEKDYYVVFTYPLNATKERVYNGKDTDYYLPKDSQLKYIGEEKVPYGMSILTKNDATEFMSLYLKAIFINYDTMNYKNIENNLKKDKEKTNEKINKNEICLCLALDENTKYVL